jgi:predicted alpha-1,2-mannosidase
MIGTAGHGHTFPGATAPFGMVQLSPDTRVDDSWDGCSGYHYDDDTIYGFSHTHLSGTGCSDYGDILFMPGTGKINYESGKNSKEGYRSHFSHANEKAEAGYYSVVLDNSKTKAELTASPRVGVHRYTFSSENDNWLLLDLTQRDEVLDSKIELVNDHAIQGYRFSKAWANDQRLYFYAEFSENFESAPYGRQNSDSASGKVIKWAFKFNGKKQVVMKVALSPVSCENAKMNMQTEVPDFDFDAVHKKVVQQWNNELGKIEAKGDETKKKIFYTALYHCFIAPNLYCDVNGDYRGRDNKIHTDTIHPQYTVFSLWDTYRALHPLFTIIQPKRDQDFINTFVKQAQEGGRLPVWELSANETNCMIAYHSVPVIVDAWMKGLTNFDTATAYEAMVSDAMQNDRGLEAYKKYGYIPAESEGESVSKTLEYAYDDWCIALAAKRMKNEADYKYFMKRSQSWRNLYDPKTGFFRPRLNNSFVEPFNPAEVNFHLTEANSWQYSLAVQQDIPGLIKAHGGDAKFIQFLDSLFSVSSKTSGRDQADISGMIGQYAQGNEPSHHMAYLYDYTSQPWKTQKLVAKICNEMYTDKPDGLCGNEDCGQMSAWYVMSMMGIYQVTPGTTLMNIAYPQMSFTLHLENGKTTRLGYHTGNSRDLNEHLFCEGVYIENKLFRQMHVEYHDIMFGNGIYVGFDKYLGPKPDWVSWQQEDNTYAKVYEANDFPGVVTAPRITNYSGRTFIGQASLKLESDPGTNIFYTLNNGPAQKYSSPIIIKENTTLASWAVPMLMTNEMPGISKAPLPSDTAVAYFVKSPDYKSITIANKYAPQYSAGGDRALIDGIRGAGNFRTGDWQGYEGKDLDVIVDLGAEKEISHLALSCLQDQGAWIFFPSGVAFLSSTDGKNFTTIENVVNTYAQNSQTVLLHEFYTDKKVKARYIKVVAKNPGLCPQWHPGRGHPSWIFADEIIIN